MGDSQGQTVEGMVGSQTRLPVTKYQYITTTLKFIQIHIPGYIYNIYIHIHEIPIEPTLNPMKQLEFIMPLAEECLDELAVVWRRRGYLLGE